MFGEFLSQEFPLSKVFIEGKTYFPAYLVATLSAPLQLPLLVSVLPWFILSSSSFSFTYPYLVGKKSC
jgi:hypothetical protein